MQIYSMSIKYKKSVTHYVFRKCIAFLDIYTVLKRNSLIYFNIFYNCMKFNQVKKG